MVATAAMALFMTPVGAFMASTSLHSPRTNHQRLCAALMQPTVSEVLDARDRLLTLLVTPSSSKSTSTSGGRDAPAAVRLKIKQCVATLELSQSKADTLAFPKVWEAIDGDWTLKYSNNAAGLSVAVPSVVAGVRTPALTVVQRIDSRAGRVDHLLQLPYNRGVITLIHDARVSSENRPAQVAIDLHSVRLNGRIIKDRMLRLPGPSFLRRGFFDITYVDESLRISRGPYGELRVFTR